MYLGQLSQLGFQMNLGTILLLVLYLMIAFYAIFSFILYYHWKEYSIDANTTKKTLLSYFIITIPLLLALSLIAYSSN